MRACPHGNHPFALSLSKGPVLSLSKGRFDRRGFDKLSPNGDLFQEN